MVSISRGEPFEGRGARVSRMNWGFMIAMLASAAFWAAVAGELFGLV